MQIREIALTELDLVYPLVQQEYPELSFKKFEDLVYEMKKEEYKIIAIIDKEHILSYIGVKIQTTLALGRHLYVLELITHPKDFQLSYYKEIKYFLEDFAKTYMCKQIEYTSRLHQHSPMQPLYM